MAGGQAEYRGRKVDEEKDKSSYGSNGRTTDEEQDALPRHSGKGKEDPFGDESNSEVKYRTMEWW